MFVFIFIYSEQSESLCAFTLALRARVRLYVDDEEKGTWWNIGTYISPKKIEEIDCVCVFVCV
jgi:hypothetical protein